MAIQTFVFSKKNWTAERAAAWLKRHDFHSGKVDETEESFRFRQFEPGLCKEGSHQTLTENFPAGISAVNCQVQESAGCEPCKGLSLEEVRRRIEQKVEEKHRTIVSGLNLVEGYDASKRTITLTVIKPGFNTTKNRYYPAEVLKRDCKIFEGAKMYANHPTRTEERDRPERDIRDWVATLTPVWAEEDGTVKGHAVVIDEALQKKLEALRAAERLSDMGVSIRALGEGREETIQGQQTLMVEALLKRRSVDFVTEPGAGGQVEALESERAEENDLDLISLAQLKERRPDLVELIESRSATGTRREDKGMELKEALEALQGKDKELTEAKAKVTEFDAMVKERDELKTKVTEAEKKERIAEAGKHLDELLEKAKLPKPAAERIKKQFAEAEKTDGMVETIEAEKKYLAEVAGPGRVKGFGESDPGDGKGVNLVESFQRLGLSEDEAKIAAAGR